MGAMLTVAVLSLATAACSSSSTPTTTATVASSPSTAASSSTSLSTTVSTTSPPSGSADASIDKAYMALFDLANPAIPPKLAAVQDGSSLRSAFTAALKSPLAKEAGGAHVLSVTVETKATCTAKSLPSPCALVTYDVLSPSGSALLSNQKGFAVNSSGRWLVSKMTICTLLTLDNGGTAPTGC